MEGTVFSLFSDRAVFNVQGTEQYVMFPVELTFLQDLKIGRIHCFSCVFATTRRNQFSLVYMHLLHISDFCNDIHICMLIMIFSFRCVITEFHCGTANCLPSSLESCVVSP